MGGEDGGIVQRAARVHDAAHAGGGLDAQAVLRAEEVAAGQQGDGELRRKGGKRLMPGFAAEALARRARMQGQPAGSGVLEAQGQLLPDLLGRRPAPAAV